jgi:hypothetical protein
LVSSKRGERILGSRMGSAGRRFGGTGGTWRQREGELGRDLSVGGRKSSETWVDNIWWRGGGGQGGGGGGGEDQQEMEEGMRARY